MHFSLTSEARFPLPGCAKTKTAKRNCDELPSRTAMEESIFAKRSQKVIENTGKGAVRGDISGRTQATPNPGRTNTQASPVLRRLKNALLPNEPENLLKALETPQYQTHQTPAGPIPAKANMQESPAHRHLKNAFSPNEPENLLKTLETCIYRTHRTQQTHAGPTPAQPKTKIAKRTQAPPDSNRANTEPAPALRSPQNAFLPNEPSNLLKKLETRQFRTHRTQQPLENRAPLHVQTPAPVFYKTNPMRTPPPMHNRGFLMSADQASTPLMRQYHAIKQQVPGAPPRRFLRALPRRRHRRLPRTGSQSEQVGQRGDFFQLLACKPAGPMDQFRERRRRVSVVAVHVLGCGR
jgi:hypothetical protein